VDEMHFDIRKQLLAYDNVMTQQREAVYKERALILTEDDMISYGRDVVKGVADDILNKYFNFDSDEEGSVDADRAVAKLKALAGLSAEIEAKVKAIDSSDMLDESREEIIDYVLSQYDLKMGGLEAEVANGMVRYIVLNILDNAWRDHLLAMDELRRGIGLRAIGQKDPLIEYQFESYSLFQDMMSRIKDTFAEQIFRVRVLSESEAERLEKRERRKVSENRNFNLNLDASSAAYSNNNLNLNAAGGGKAAPVHKGTKIGRNDPCPCGSGKKYKRCCGKGL
ncbi:MAG: SEC-C domain-containing protein, partial [Synergistaceae bacterium]|nr:SEC-C domain-containing protein [Synergistaceae bacterium]